MGEGGKRVTAAGRDESIFESAAAGGGMTTMTTGDAISARARARETVVRRETVWWSTMAREARQTRFHSYSAPPGRFAVRRICGEQSPDSYFPVYLDVEA